MDEDARADLTGVASMKPPIFGHPPETIRFWKRLVREALRLSGSTPLYVFSAQPVAERIAELDEAIQQVGLLPARGTSVSPVPGRRLAGQFTADDSGAPPKSARETRAPQRIRHWLACKTQPVRPLLRWWRERGGDIEVVSEFELRAALTEGFPAARILVNGPAKHHWLPQLPLRGLAVNFDSAAELATLLPFAKQLGWRIGLRLCTRQEFDPENPKLPTQFGFTADEAITAIRRIRRAGLEPQIVHLHLRTNVATPQIYQRAVREVAGVCRAARLQPAFLDLGGGLPPRHALSRSGEAFDRGWKTSTASGLAEVLQDAAKAFPGLQEIWLENGRFVSAAAGVLVVKVRDVKRRRGLRQLICDGGRTLNALVSNWEQHALLPLSERRSRNVLTAVYGPTCMAFDQLALRSLPESIRPGDHLIWLEAGAYHIPWETRFSHGHAAVVWHDERRLRITRERQHFEDWWSDWILTR